MMARWTQIEKKPFVLVNEILMKLFHILPLFTLKMFGQITTKLCFFPDQNVKVSGFAMLCSGIWVQIGLHRYMELSTDYTNTFQILLVGMGLLILFVGTLACCCTIKAQSSLLYLVRNRDILAVMELIM